MRVLQICSIYHDRPLFKLMFEAMATWGIESIVYNPKWVQADPQKDVYIVSKKHSKLEKLIYWGEQRYILQDIESRISLNDIHCVYAHRLLYGGHAALHLYKKYHIPYIVEICNSDIYGCGRNIKRFRKQARDIMLNAQRVLFFSKPYMDLVINKYIDEEFVDEIKGKSEVVLLGINRFFLDNIMLPDSHGLPIGQTIKLISVAEIDKNKNVLTLIKSCQLLQNRGYDVKLRLLGRIVNQNVFKKAVSYGFVEYFGIRPKEELLGILRESDIFAMPSIHESFGLVYAEAMTQGLPVIYTRGQGFDGQYKEGEVGYSVDCFNAQEIADRIIDILGDYRNISNRCINNSKRYSWDIIAKRYKEIYDSCLSFT